MRRDDGMEKEMILYMVEDNWMSEMRRWNGKGDDTVRGRRQLEE